MRYRRDLLHFFAVISLVFLFLACQPTYQNRDVFKQNPQLNEKPDRVGDTVVITSLRGNSINWYLTSPHIEEFSKKKIVLADTVLVYYFKNDEIVSTLTANKAKIDEIKKLMTATGDVVVISDNGILKTELLYWNLTNNQIFTQEFVTIIRGENVINGRNLLTNIELQSAELDDVGATGEIYEEDIDI